MGVWNVASAIVVSLGGGGLIVVGLSGWLGKVFADRLMAQERAKHDHELEKLRSELWRENEENLRNIEHGLKIHQETFLLAHKDRIQIYRLVVDIVANILSEFDLALRAGNALSPEVLHDFNRDRIKAYGYLGMLAPQNVMDAYDRLTDLLLKIANGEPYDWALVRNRSIELINEVRKDIGFDPTSIEYRGEF